jgi:hypothetical protein
VFGSGQICSIALSLLLTSALYLHVCERSYIFAIYIWLLSHKTSSVLFKLSFFFEFLFFFRVYKAAALQLANACMDERMNMHVVS